MSPRRTDVVSADADNSLTLAAAAGSEVTALGVLVVATREGPALMPGTPSAIAIGDASVAIGLDIEQSRHRAFGAKVGEALAVVGAPTVVYVGCGSYEDLDVDVVRRAGASFVRGAGRSGVAVLVLPASIAPDGGHERFARAAAEGIVLANYSFNAHKSDDDNEGPTRVVVAGSGFDVAVLAQGVAQGTTVADAVLWARDLVNEPPSSMTPTRLAEEALARLEAHPDVTVEVWDEDRIVAERLGGLLGVARGSAEPPRLVRATYEPPGAGDGGDLRHVVLVGKGITFDSGGLSLKSAEGMMTMKTDMSGAATVLATLSACADLGVGVRVTAIAAMTENMPGGKAIKPGDVLTIRNGRTIEVLNTDAEGRLILADGLSLAAELDPDAIVDLATLTGAQVVALGNSIAAVFGNQDALVDEVLAASRRAGEPMWRLPLVAEYDSHIESDVADMKNIGRPMQGGAIVAALLLERFVGEVPWVHIDMAGPARSDENEGLFAKGGTGFGVRSLVELLESYGATEE